MLSALHIAPIASTVGVTSFFDEKGIGLLMQRELNALSHVMDAPKRPLGIIIGGSKISTKLGIIDQFLEKADHLFVGGAMANTLLMAAGVDVGASLVEKDMLPVARKILADAANSTCALHLPVDAITQTGITSLANGVPNEHSIYDIGPETLDMWAHIFDSCSTLLWNGPVGLFENPDYAEGSLSIAAMLAAHPGFTLAGGGDTLRAIHLADAHGFSFLSTGGGAMLTLLEGQQMPALNAL